MRLKLQSEIEGVSPALVGPIAAAMERCREFERIPDVRLASPLLTRAAQHAEGLSRALAEVRRLAPARYARFMTELELAEHESVAGSIADLARRSERSFPALRRGLHGARTRSVQRALARVSTRARALVCLFEDVDAIRPDASESFFGGINYPGASPGWFSRGTRALPGVLRDVAASNAAQHAHRPIERGARYLLLDLVAILDSAGVPVTMEMKSKGTLLVASVFEEAVGVPLTRKRLGAALHPRRSRPAIRDAATAFRGKAATA